MLITWCCWETTIRIYNKVYGNFLLSLIYQPMVSSNLEQVQSQTPGLFVSREYYLIHTIRLLSLWPTVAQTVRLVVCPCCITWPEAIFWSIYTNYEQQLCSARITIMLQRSCLKAENGALDHYAYLMLSRCGFESKVSRGIWVTFFCTTRWVRHSYWVCHQSNRNDIYISHRSFSLWF
jgi:hypothetical protein